MIEDLKKLLVVQDKDVELLKLSEKKNELPKLLQELKDAVDEKTKELEAQKNVLKEIQVAHKSLEIDAESKLTARRKYETQLMTVKTNQEYKALEKEIFTLKTEISRVEDNILEKMGKIEDQNLLLKKIDFELQERKKKLTERESEIQKAIQDLEQELQKILGEKEILIKDVKPDVLRRYNRILERVRGKAIVPIVDRSCQGCHTLLPPQITVNARKSSDPVACDNCSRLLYIPEDLKPSQDSDASIGKNAESV